MNPEQTDELTAESAEIDRLRARVAQLEDELAALQAWANGVVADAQQRVYWLERLHLDLDPVMRRLPVDFAVGVYLTLRDSYRWAGKQGRALSGFVRRTPR